MPVICRRCNRILIGGVECTCRPRAFSVSPLLAEAAERIASRVRERFEAEMKRVMAGGSVPGLTTSTVNRPPAEPVSIDSIRKLFDTAELKRIMDPFYRFPMFERAMPLRPEPDYADAMKYVFSAFPMRMALPSRPMFIALDVGAESYPTLNAQLTVTNTAEIRRISSLLARQHPGNHSRRHKRIVRLLRREIARQGR